MWTVWFLLSSILFSLSARASESKDFGAQISPSTLHQYREISRQYVRELCSSGTENTYYKRLAAFNGDGSFIPLLPDGSLDSDTIIQHVPLIEEKITWIEKNLVLLDGNHDFQEINSQIDVIEKKVDLALDLKKDFFESTDVVSKGELQQKSSILIKEIQALFEAVLHDAPFLKPFKYPVNHLRMRGEYDRFKFREDVLGNRFSNRIFFARRILEDGAPTHNQSKSDIFFRTLVNTLHFNLAHEQIFLEENNRYDLSSFITITRNILARGHAESRLRLSDWRNRELRKLNYYRLILRNLIYQEGGQPITVAEYIAQKLKARDELKKFVMEKYVNVYQFWSKHAEIYQALFAMETILFNEVGTMDGPNSLERRDVLRVVKKRHGISFYANLSEREPLFLTLIQQKASHLAKNTWINLLLKEGEFSFTYYYMHGAPKIFCPDGSGSGERLRKENLDLSLSILKETDSYEGVRYFSRASMVGRINMASLWDDFVPLPEGAGGLIPHWKALWKVYQAGQYRFYYYFFDSQGQTFKVVEINEKTYVVPFTGEGVYYYRDPNLFRFFATR
ncbi:MAG: hypothetical protein A2X86_07380 [Bdellovibrionales bacterium GWA2_49_15]|nr:MAG: hypothetical protein A2X86_07380 [Bdellovibrionales bacterium GWA2_49_15]HAZ11901.1 hypothetical protein [Bdellovibrionales bacterium]